jgi:KaiC/GvpD/RAD55 family RecA-like ATPase
MIAQGAHSSGELVLPVLDAVMQRLDRIQTRDESPIEPSALWMPCSDDSFSLKELTDSPPPMDFIVAPYLPAGCATILTGAGGTSKTGIAAMLAIGVCTGKVLFGEPVMDGKVLFVSAEDRRAVLRRHVWANTRDLSEIQLRQVVGNLVVKDTVGLGFKLTRHIDGQTETAKDLDILIKFATKIDGLRLVIFDTLSRLNGGEESNEDLARFVEAMERVSVKTGATTLALHHSGKAQMRADANDQYSGRGGSALSDNARSVMHVSRIMPGMKGSPVNASELIAHGGLLRLSHVKSNYAAPAPDRYLERVVTPFAATLVPFRADFAKGDASEIWQRLSGWMATQGEVDYPTARTIDNLGKEYGSRDERRSALNWARDRGLVLELDHPAPHGKLKSYLQLPEPAATTNAEDCARASGEH